MDWLTEAIPVAVAAVAYVAARLVTRWALRPPRDAADAARALADAAREAGELVREVTARHRRVEP